MADEPVAVANTLASPLGPDRVGQVGEDFRASDILRSRTFWKSVLISYLIRCARLEEELPGLCQAASQALEWSSCGTIGVWQYDNLMWKLKNEKFDNIISLEVEKFGNMVYSPVKNCIQEALVFLLL